MFVPLEPAQLNAEDVKALHSAGLLRYKFDDEDEILVEWLDWSDIQTSLEWDVTE